jgi:hypothetical protein
VFYVKSQIISVLPLLNFSTSQLLNPSTVRPSDPQTFRLSDLLHLPRKGLKVLFVTLLLPACSAEIFQHRLKVLGPLVT